MDDFEKKAMRPASAEELANWDELVTANPDGGNVLQSFAWGDFKSRWGWRPRRFVYELRGGRIVAAQWMTRSIPLLGELWYCPKGPGVTSYGDFRQVVEQTRAATVAGGGGATAGKGARGAAARALWLRFEPEILADDVSPADLGRLGIVRANRDPASKSTIFVDLRSDEDAIAAGFSQSARRNIRKAEAAGVAVEAVALTEANLQTMFELMQATEARAKYGLRPREYFLDYWRAQIKAGQAQMFFARHEHEVLAGIFVTAVGRRAWYKDGGSFDKKRELQASYLLQWEVMRRLKAHGIAQYDMVGVPNRDQIGKGNSRQGLYDFKSKFNPEITEFIGCWDLAPNIWKYRAWRLVGERIAARLANMRPERFLY